MERITLESQERIKLAGARSGCARSDGRGRDPTINHLRRSTGWEGETASPIRREVPFSMPETDGMARPFGRCGADESIGYWFALGVRVPIMPLRLLHW
jgi:hypothetical protein